MAKRDRRWILALAFAALVAAAGCSRGGLPALPEPKSVSSETESEFRRAREAFQIGNYAVGVPLLRAAASAGHPEAQFFLAQRYRDGRGVPRDPESSARWAEKAAANRHHEAQYFVAICYQDGFGVRRDLTRAAEWAKRSALAGNARAQDMLGGYYAAGKGVGKDEREAVRWFKKSAEGGYGYAYYNVGMAYLHGIGTEKNFNEAEAYILIAAEKRIADARLQLANVRAARAVEAVGKLDVIRWLPPRIDPDLVAKIRERIRDLPVAYGYELARRLAADSPSEALEWYWVTQIRAVYDARRCADQSAEGALVRYTSTLRELQPAFRDRAAVNEARRRALELEPFFPGDTDPRWICRHGMQTYLDFFQGTKKSGKIRPESEWPLIRAEVRARFARRINSEITTGR